MQEPPRDKAAMGSDQALIGRIRQLSVAMHPEPTGLMPEIAPLDGIRAVLFDVYGTLVISGCGDIGLGSEQRNDHHFRRAVAAAGVDGLPGLEDFDGASALVENIAASHARSGALGVDYPEVDILAIWAELLANLGVERDASDTRRIALEYELRTNPVWPMPGLRDVIDLLRRRGLVLGIVSNAQFYTPLMLAAFLGRDIARAGFDPRCCSWSFQHGVGKPSTRIYQPALAALQEHYEIAPEQVLYIGNDIRNDIWPASQLGCWTALFAGDARSLRLRQDDTRLSDVRPDRVLTALDQVPLNLLPA